MGLFKEMRRLFKGYDLTAGANFNPTNRKERRAEERRVKKLTQKQQDFLRRHTS